MRILITGAGGFLSSYLIPLLIKEHTIYGLYRKTPRNISTNVLVGDITQTGLGLQFVPPIDAVIHTAAKLSFSPKDKDEIYATNCQGTVNLLHFMTSHNISRLFFISTAYLFDHNDYEKSKRITEEAIESCLEVKATIIRPSVIVGDSQVEGLPPLQGFYIVVRGVDFAKKYLEAKLALPHLKLTIRLKGDPDGHLNLIPVDIVAQEIAKIVSENRQGIFYVTHPEPPTLAEIAESISKAIGASVQIVPNFISNPAEKIVARFTKELVPYMAGADLKSDIICPKLSDEFIVKTTKAFLKS